MKQIKVYDADFENIADICELHCVNEWEVIGAMLDAIEDMGIDITEYMQFVKNDENFNNKKW